MKIVVPISGGKDSQLCLQLAVDKVGVNDVHAFFCNTNFEHPLTYEHIKFMSNYYQIKIHEISNGSVEQQVIKHKRFPGGGARFCTEELKIWPTKKYLKTLALEKKSGFEVWYGMRTEESYEREKRYANKIADDTYLPHEFMPGKYPKYLAKLGIVFRLPIVEWREFEVMQALNGKQNELYKKGFDRVGCFPCLASGDMNKEKSFAFDEFGNRQKTIVLKLEKEIGKSIWTSERGKARNNPNQMCFLCMI